MGETLSSICIPKEDNQIQLYASTQWIDFTQNLVASALGIGVDQIDMQVRRIGGGYGGKATPSFFYCLRNSRCQLESKQTSELCYGLENQLGVYRQAWRLFGKIQ